jgi:DNA repair protein RecO (recombination protein O)
VLRRRPLRESEEILSLLTPQRGRLDCVVRTTRKALALVEPFTHLRGQFAQGKELAYLNEVALLHPHVGLRDRLVTLEVGGHWLQVLYRSVTHEQDARLLFVLLARALSELEVSDNPEVLDLWMSLRVLKLLGLSPELHQCCLCGSKGHLGVFSACDGGLLCCRCGAGRACLPAGGLEALRLLERSRIVAVAEIRLNQRLVQSLAPLLTRFFEKHCWVGGG